MTSTPGPFRHTKKRLYERYGLRIDPVEYRRLCREIKRLLPVLETFPTREQRLIVPYPHSGREVRWVFCPVAGLIVTALHPQPKRKADIPRTTITLQGEVRRKRPQGQPYRRPHHVHWEEED